MLQKENAMRLLPQALCLTFLLPSAVLYAASKNPADYPLRVHIFGRSETTFYHNRFAEESKGEGRANLFQNGDPHGVDFTFDCSEKLHGSLAYETYDAKWKKPGQELTVLLPAFGQTGKFDTCDLKTDVKDFTYVSHQGRLSPEPMAQYKDWMVRHDYDPEHGKNEPIRLEQAPAPPSN
jgi:hypothetical protein